MIIDCMKCPVRGRGCDDCAVTVLLAPGSARHLPAAAELRLSGELLLDAAESSVVSMLVGVGLVDAGAATTLRARREMVQHCGAGREVG